VAVNIEHQSNETRGTTNRMKRDGAKKLVYVNGRKYVNETRPDADPVIKQEVLPAPKNDRQFTGVKS
jgi:hypothetical protein